MKDLIIVRGAGDLATGIIAKLHAVGWKVLALELPEPLAVRRLVAFSEAVWEGRKTVEGIEAIYATGLKEVVDALESGNPVVTVDPEGLYIRHLKPWAVIDATLIKKGITTHVSMAPIVIGVGPGNVVGEHCHCAVESMRGHHLGRVYYSGTPIKDTGIPGNVGGFTQKRVIKAPVEGSVEVVKDITEMVQAGDIIARINGEPVRSEITGLIRGMLRQGAYVKKGMKMADVDPRINERDNCHHISDKARCIAGGVLEALLTLERQASA